MALRRHIDLSVGRPPGPEWRRRPGRPRTRWIDQIRRDSSSSPVERWRRLSAVAMLLEPLNGPRRPRDIDDDDDDDEYKYLTDLTYFRGDADARMGRFTRLLHAERC